MKTLTDLTNTDMKQQISELDTATMSAFFKLMSEETRFKLIYCLAHKEKRCVTDLADIIDASVATTSHHLQILKKDNLIQSERRGKQVFYFIDNPKIIHFVHVGLNFKQTVLVKKEESHE